MDPRKGPKRLDGTFPKPRGRSPSVNPITMRPMHRLIRTQLPNSLTILRVVVAAAFFAVLACYRYPDHLVAWGNTAVALFAFAAMTDALDGHLARRWNVVSEFGRLMDPFCDKVLVIGAFVMLCGPNFLMPAAAGQADATRVLVTGVYPWMVVIIIARELLVTSIRGVLEARGVAAGAKRSGKLKMILQSFAIPTILLLVINFQPGENTWVRVAIDITVWFTLVATVWSGLPYLIGLRQVLVATGGAAQE
jgi:CDP-diacylglycerol--glycerol-3-phosphate 3-phosphatidyltransferase